MVRRSGKGFASCASDLFTNPSKTIVLVDATLDGSRVRYSAMLADFGFCHYTTSPIWRGPITWAYGTKIFGPPELVHVGTDKRITVQSEYAADIWALGLILWDLTFGQRPVEWKSEKPQAETIEKKPNAEFYFSFPSRIDAGEY